MPFFTYNQNNTFGEFVGPSYVIVEADSPTEADAIAEAHTPVYFDGCADGIDCPCCGDRWYPVYDEGNPVPMIYNLTLDAEHDGLFPHDYLIRYADGRVVTGEQPQKERN